MQDGQVQLSDIVNIINLYADALSGEVLELVVTAPSLTEKCRQVNTNITWKDDVTYGFLVNYCATEPIDVTLDGVGVIREARGLSATAILESVAEFQPTVAGSIVTLPPMSLVRVMCHA